MQNDPCNEGPLGWTKCRTCMPVPKAMTMQVKSARGHICTCCTLSECSKRPVAACTAQLSCTGMSMTASKGCRCHADLAALRREC